MGNAFSLFELLIAIALVTILSAISYPLYTEHIIKKNREQAEIVLLEIGNRLEEEHSVSGSYKNANVEQLIPLTAEKLPFHFVITTTTENDYVIKAIPTSSQSTSSRECQILTLASDGSHCW